MANTVDITTLLDGPRHIILQIFLQGDGVGQDLENFVLLDPISDLGLKKDSRFSIDEVLFNFAGFDAILSFDTGLVTKSMIWVLPEGASNYVDFRPFGGFKDRTSVPGPGTPGDGTGKILLSTLGMNSVNDFGSLLLKIRKD